MKKNTNKILYAEPGDYIPKEIRKELKLGEYSESAKKAKKTATPAKKKVKRSK